MLSKCKVAYCLRSERGIFAEIPLRSGYYVNFTFCALASDAKSEDADAGSGAELAVGFDVNTR